MEPLDPKLASLLASERMAEAPVEALGRVWSRVALAPPLPASTHMGGAGHGWIASHAIGVAAAAFVVGGIAGAAVYAVVEKPAPERVVYVDRPTLSAYVPPPPPPSAAPLAPVVASALPPAAPTASGHPTPAPSSTSSLSAERALLDHARGALASGDAAGALVLLGDHAHRFPKPQLAEEREALVIQSLVSLGRYDEARAAAARFKAASPGSLFMPAIEASLGSIP
jgi:hypothetical protein